MSTYTHIGVDFVDANGVRLTSVQMVRNGRAVAVADYCDGKIFHQHLLPSVDLPVFLAEAERLVSNSTPITFRETKLP